MILFPVQIFCYDTQLYLKDNIKLLIKYFAIKSSCIECVLECIISMVIDTQNSG